jgi:hypothetical protein
MKRFHLKDVEFHPQIHERVLYLALVGFRGVSSIERELSAKMCWPIILAQTVCDSQATNRSVAGGEGGPYRQYFLLSNGRLGIIYDSQPHNYALIL